MAKAVGFRPSGDEGRLLENVIFIELKRRNYTVYYHRDQKECDFIATRPDAPTLVIQACFSLADSDTKKREVAGLLEAMNANHLKEGLIITATESDEIRLGEGGTQQAIKVIPISTWLLSM